MNKELYDEIVTTYNDYKAAMDDDSTELKELENNPIVKRYLLLKDIHDKKSYYFNERHILGEIISKYGNGRIKETNNLWYKFLEGSVSKIKRFSPKKLENMDDEQIAIIYWDIEDSTRDLVILKEDEQLFEKTHNVVYGNTDILDAADRYYNTRHKFFEKCIEQGQDAAVKMLLKK